MYRVFKPFREPVGDKGDVGNETRHFGVAASPSCAARLAVAGGRVLDIDGGECNGKPSCVRGPNESSKKTDQVDVTIVIGDMNRGLQHEGAEGYPTNPGYEGDNHDDDKDQEDNATSVVLSVQHIYGSSETPDDVQNAGEPNDLLRKEAYEQNIGETEHHGEREADEEEKQRVVVEGERFTRVARDHRPIGTLICDWEQYGSSALCTCE